MNPTTGPKSTSFKLSLGGIATGVGMIITDYVKNPQAVNSKIDTVVGGVVVVISLVSKLWHDASLNKAGGAQTIVGDVAAIVTALETRLKALESTQEAPKP